MADAQPAAIAKKLAGWARDIDVGMRNDGMTVEGCKAAIDVAHRSEDAGRDFSWKNNLLSGRALRKHYERLRIKGSKTRAAANDGSGFDYHAFGEKWDEICGTQS